MGRLEDSLPFRNLRDISRFISDEIHSEAPDLLLLSHLCGFFESTFVGKNKERTPENFYPVTQEDFSNLFAFKQAVHDTLKRVEASRHEIEGEEAKRNAVCKAGNFIWSFVGNREVFRDRPHVQTLFSLEKEKDIDCFGVNLLTVAVLYELGFEGFHLLLSEDHCWVGFLREGGDRKARTDRRFAKAIGTGGKSAGDKTAHDKREGKTGASATAKNTESTESTHGSVSNGDGHAEKVSPPSKSACQGKVAETGAGAETARADGTIGVRAFSAQTMATAEMTWHGRTNASKRGQEIGAGFPSAVSSSKTDAVGSAVDEATGAPSLRSSWLYLGGLGLVCDRAMAAMAVVANMNWTITKTKDSDEVGDLMREVFRFVGEDAASPMFSLPTALCNRADIEEIEFEIAEKDERSSSAFPASVEGAKGAFEDAVALAAALDFAVIYPSSMAGNFYYRRGLYRSALRHFATASRAASAYSHSKDDEELRKEIAEAMEAVAKAVKKWLKESGGDGGEEGPFDEEAAELLLSFWDGACLFGEVAVTPAWTSSSVAHFLSSFRPLSPSLRSKALSSSSLSSSSLQSLRRSLEREKLKAAEIEMFLSPLTERSQPKKKAAPAEAEASPAKRRRDL